MSDEGSVEVFEAGPALSELMLWSGAAGFQTTGCNCGHDGLGPSWHLSGCPWQTRAWAEKARELAMRLDDAAAPSTPACDEPDGGR